MPTPSSSDTRLVVHTAGMRIIRMSISGCDELDSAMTHATARTTEAISRAITETEPQPHVGPSLTPSSNATSHADSKTAPGQLSFPAVRTGDSGTMTFVATVAIAKMIIGIQKSQW